MTQSPQPFSPPATSLPWPAWILLAVTGAIALGPLTPTWNSNPNYSFGWLIPFVCLFLLHERWPTRPPRTATQPLKLGIVIACWGLIFFAFRIIGEANPDWRPGLWILLTLYVGATLAWLQLYGGWAWVKHFAFPVCFLLLCLPWLFQIEYPFTQGLMKWNTWLVSHSLELLAISAKAEGNIIQLQNCQLGVEEACSGILSLQASLMMGCLLGEIYALSVRNRWGLVAIAVSLALIGNYLRTLFLALTAAYNGPEAVASWHDTAGFAILIFTGVGTWIASLALASRKVPISVPTTAGTPLVNEPRQTRLALRFAIGIFAVALVAEGVTQGWYSWKESFVVHHPAWTIKWPTVESFKEIKLSDVTLAALRSDEVKTGSWNDAKGWSWTTYWIRYEAKPYTKIVLGWHNPDNCLPSSGLVKDRDFPTYTVDANGIQLRVNPKRFFAGKIPVYIFWIVYPNSGELPVERDTRIPLPFTQKITTHFADVINGDRGVGVETMEIALAGPPDYESAREAMIAELRQMVVPLAGKSGK